MLGTVALNQRACMFKLHPASVHVCSTFSRPAAHRVSKHIYHNACLIMWQGTNSNDCNSYTRLAGMLQYPCFKCCFYVFVLSCVCYVLCASVYMCFVVTCWERADLLALVCGVFCEFVTFPLVSWVRCGT